MRFSLRVLLFAALLAWAVSAPAAAIFSTNSTWKLFKGVSEASSPDITAWRLPAFNDSGWTNGAAPFYYGETFPSGTVLSDMQNTYSTIFLRRMFVLSNIAEMGWLTLGARCDDGFLAWINGTNVCRYNVPAGERTYNTFSAANAAEPIPFSFYQITNLASFLVNGTNVIAVQVFNTSLGSSDLVMDASLSSSVPDLTPPVITSVSPPALATLSNLTQVIVTFSEPVMGVHAYDLLVNGVGATNVSSVNNSFTFTFPPPVFGTVQLTWSSTHGITDQAAPPNVFNATEPGASWQYTLVDAQPPVVTMLNPPVNALVRSLRQMEVTFSESVTNVDAADLLINNTPATNLTRRSASNYLFEFPEPPVGVVQVGWAASHGIRDVSPAANAFAGGNWACTLDPYAPLADVRINEFLAGYGSTTGLKDEDGEAQDWIELYNNGTNSVSLSGWSLTDDVDAPDQWTFPPVTLGPRQFLVVFASGKDRRPATTNGLHTNFKLSPNGEYLGLYDAESPRHAMSKFDPQFPEQRNDYSYGLDSLGFWRFFATPTPGASNGNSSIAGMVAAPHFSVGHGFFNAPFTLHLTTTTPDATIRYTTNGSAPSLTQGSAYTGPLVISRTAVLRAAAFKTDLLASTVEVRTFIFLDDVITQPSNPPGFPTSWISATADYEMDPNVVNNPAYSGSIRGDLMSVPTVSIVMDNDHLFSSSGIYANPGTSGVTWERPGSVEMIFGDGREGFQVNCGVRMQGGVGRSASVLKHSFRFLFKGDYGASKLEFPFFEGNPVTEFDTITLRAGFNNSYVWSAADAARMHYLQDQWVRDAYRAMGQESGYGNFVHLYVNGLYWGLYNATERPSAPYCADHFGGDKSEWDAINSSEAIDGNRTAWDAMYAIANAGITTDTAYQSIQQYLNVTNLVDYMMVNFYGGNQDWDDHNWYAARRRVPGAGYMFFCWDAERCLENPTGNDKTGVNQADKPSRLYAQLRAYAEFRLLFADRAHRHLFNSGALTTEPAKALFATLTNQIYRAMVGESARWGDKLREPPFTRDSDWLNGANCINWEMNTQFPQRTAAFLTQLRNAGLYPNTVAPSFGPQHGGRVARGFSLSMSAPAGTIYYTLNGSDPRVYGTGAVSPTAAAWTGSSIVLNVSTTVKSRVFDGANWSALNEATYQVAEVGSPLRFTEIMYNPSGGDTYEFIEIQNTGGTTVDMGRMTLEGVTFEFTPGTLLAPGARLVVAPALNVAAWATRYPGVTPVGYYYAGKLDNGGERLALLDPSGRVLTSVTYDDQAGWPTAPDGGGYSLEVIDPNGDPSDPANWRASSVVNGTPGAAASTTPATIVVLNEIMADNQGAVSNEGAFPDWIELRNTGSNSTNIAGWRLSDDGNPLKFVFPPDTIVPAGGYLVVWCDAPTNPAPGSLHAGFSLNRDGESLFLYDASGTRVDAVTLGLQLPNYSVGRLGTAWQLTTPTPGVTNQAATLAPVSQLVINEWLGNPAPGTDDWVELFNRDSTRPVALRGLWLATTSALFQVRSLSFVAPGGFAVLHADGNPGVDHLDLKLPKEGGSITLYDETATQFDQTTYAAQSTGVARGRWPNGGAGFAAFPDGGSPGATNYLVAYTGPFLNEVMARNVSAVHDGTGRVADWVELFNPNPTNFNLGGMSLSLDKAEPGQWVFPANTLIPANGFLVVWCDSTRPASTSFEADLNCGQALDAESGGAYLFNVAGQMMNLVEFGFQIADQSIGRNGGVWRLLASPTPGAVNSANATLGSTANLRVNEWMANPASGDDWFELFNTDNLPVDLSGLFLSDDPAQASQTQFQVAPLSFIAGRGFVKLVADGQPGSGRNHVNFALDDLGEMLLIYGASTNLIDAVGFGAQATGVSQGRLLDGSTNIVSFPFTPTPGESNYQPLAAPFINEVLTHTAPPLEDAVELFNPAATNVAIGGWFLSNTSDKLKKFRIPDGTVVPAGGFLVLYEWQFKDGSSNSFTFDATQGGQTWISEADAGGTLTGRRATVAFGAAFSGVSFGRYATSVGVDFVAMSQRTFGHDNPVTLVDFRAGTGLSNAAPTVGPVVINEIMYHPPEQLVDGELVEDHDEEFIELHNPTASEVPLFNPLHPTNTWQLRAAVSFVFPTNTFLPTRGHLLVVDFDPATNAAALAAFRLKYGVDSNAPIFGPFRGHLDNAGESVELYQPDQPAGVVVPCVLIDRVNYSPIAPWPVSADGAGFSLQRVSALRYGNEPTNWLASVPTAGRVNGTQAEVPPLIVRQPADQTNYAGLSATLNVLADGTPPLFYQWQFNGSVFTGAVQSVLTFTNVRLEHAGGYSVVVTNVNGSVTSRVAVLTVKQPLLEILQQPQGQTAVIGGQASFSVMAVGLGTLTYQWRQNGALIPDATNAVFTLANVQPIHAGLYTVAVASSASNQTSQAAQLIVVPPPPPGIISQPASRTVAVNSSVTISLVATGAPPVSYQWRLSNTNLPGVTTNALTFLSAQFSDAGTYTVVVSNPGGSVTSAPAILTVMQPPAFTVQPLSQSVPSGSNAVLTVTASGGSPLFLQWTFNGMNLPNATNATLTLSNIQPAQAGPYQVRASNAVGVAFSAVATVIVPVPIVITSQPQSQNVWPYTNVVLSIGLTGSQPLIYQWLRNGTNLAGATNATLTLAGIHPTNAGSYLVVVTNTISAATSAPALLTVYTNPIITVQPIGRSAAVGSNATFNVVAVSSSPLRYQWYFNTNTALANATNDNYTVSNVQTNNYGFYNVRVFDDFGSVWSDPAQMADKLKPAIFQQPTPASGAGFPGGNYSISISAYGPQPLTYNLRKNGNVILSQTLNDTNCTFTLTNLVFTNCGSYEVIVTNIAGNAPNSSRAYLTVMDPLTNRFAWPGSNVTFSFQAASLMPNSTLSSNNFLKYQWWFNETNLVSTVTNLKTTVTNIVLNLTNVQAAQEGSYTVVLTNANGLATTQSATLTLWRPPVITVQPQSRTNVLTTEAVFSVAATVLSTPSYQWLKSVVSGEWSVISDATNATLSVPNVQTNHAGNYQVRITTLGGTVLSQPATLTVVDQTVSGVVEMEFYAGPMRDGVGSRRVTFKGTDATNGPLAAWSLPLNFTNATASFTLAHAPLGLAHLSARTAWHLRTRLPVNFTNYLASVNFTGTSALRPGDLDGSNTADLGDYFILAAAWYTSNPAADLDGNGLVDIFDYFLLSHRWQWEGDAE